MVAVASTYRAYRGADGDDGKALLHFRPTQRW